MTWRAKVDRKRSEWFGTEGSHLPCLSRKEAVGQSVIEDHSVLVGLPMEGKLQVGAMSLALKGRARLD